MLAPPKRQSAEDSVHSEQGPAPDSASVRRVPAQIESFHDAMSRDSSLGIPLNKFFSICGNYDSVIYGRALNPPMTVTRRIRRRGERGISCKTIARGMSE